MDEQQIAEDINRAELARQITQNPVYIQAMHMIQAQAFNEFSNTEADQSGIRDEAWRLMQSHKEFSKVLEHLMEKGLFADDSKKMKEADDNFKDKDLYT